jgi:acyl dehydratase
VRIDADLISIEIGDVLPSLEFGPISRSTIALYAGASGDHDPVHIDIDAARTAGFSDVLVHEMLPFGVLSRLVTEWVGAERLRSFGARFISGACIHDLIQCEGLVSDRFVEDGELRARIELKATAQDGRLMLLGDAVIAIARAAGA